MLRGCAALAVACAVVVGSASAARAETQRAMFDATVNSIAAGQLLLILGDDGNVAVKTADLDRLGVPYAPAAVEHVDGEDQVWLRSLAPGVSYSLDVSALTIAVVVDPKLLARHAFDLSRPAPIAVDASHPKSFFANYDVNASSLSAPSGSLESGYSHDDRLLYTNANFAPGLGLQRSQTYYALDDPARLNRTQFGDATVNGDALLGTIDVFGASTQRLFDLDPYVYRFPSPAIAGVIATPGTAQVYVNGSLVRTLPLAPGGFNVDQIPLATGGNQVAVVVRNQQGGVEQTFSQPFFAVNDLLKPGLTAYDYGAGFVRASGTFGSYGAPAAVANYRVGASDDATFGGMLQASAATQALDLSTDLKIPDGAVHVAAAGSMERGKAGTAFDGALQLGTFPTTFTASIAAQGPTFESLGNELPGILAPPRLSENVSLTQAFGRGTSFSVGMERQVYQTRNDVASASVGATRQLGAGVQVSVLVQRSRSAGQAATTYGSVSIVRALGKQRTLTTTYAGPRDGPSVDYRVDPVSNDVGYGYEALVGRGADASDAFRLTAHTAVADIDASALRVEGLTDDQVEVAGGLAMVGGHTMLSRPIENGFALVDTGVPGLLVTDDNRPVGRTDRDGYLLVDSLTANAPNRIAVDPDGLPFNVELHSDGKAVDPSYRGGSVVRLEAEQVKFFTGRVTVRSGDREIVPSDGRLTLVGERASRFVSELDDDGNFYFENLKPGDYRASAAYAGGSCSFALTVAPASALATKLGTLSCDADSR